MKMQALVGATIGALVGAVLWAVVLYFTEYEIGWIAWGIGGLVGLGAKLLGGTGRNMALACAGLAVVGIFLGKLLGMYVVLGQVANTELTESLYQETLTDAQAFAALGPDADHRQFMVDYRYTWEEGIAAEDVSDEELAEFTAYTAPYLEEIAAAPPTFEEWRDQGKAEWLTLPMMLSLVVENLALMDLVFVILGVVTAYQIVNRSGDEETGADSGPNAPPPEELPAN